MTAPLEVSQENGTWTFTLSRPEKRNALSDELVNRLIDGVAEARAQQARALVFRGQGNNFSAGFDFSGVESQSEGDLLLRFVRIELLLQTIASSACVTIGLVHGRNFGAGVDLFAACRYRVASADASFRMPGLRFGLVLGTRRFGAIVGAERARQVLETSSTFSAAQALEMGFLHKIAELGAWSEEITTAVAAAGAIDPVSRAALHRVLSPPKDDSDLAELVRSAARPGLKARIAQYLASG